MRKRIDWEDLQNKILRHFWIDHKGLFCKKKAVRIEGFKNSTISKALTKAKREREYLFTEIDIGVYREKPIMILRRERDHERLDHRKPC